MKKGTPVRYMAVESCDKVRRNVFCLNYGDCLDLAIHRKWPGFSCQSCDCYEQEKLEGDHLSDDYARCMALAYVSGAVEITTGSRMHA
ncbi:MAG: hypothetical protein AB9866_27890 [Syntrophobacteraceae bacterium]